MSSAETLTAEGGKWSAIPWNLNDFVGSYHLRKIKSTAPVPGTQVVIEQSRREFQTTRQDVLDEELRAIEGKHANRSKMRCRKARAEATVMADTSIRDGLKRVERAMDLVKDLDPAKHAPKVAQETNIFIDERAHQFIKWCHACHAFNVERMCKQGYEEMDVQLDETMDTGLHIAARAGDVDLVRVLLKYNANPNLTNAAGDSPIHLVWRSWHIDHGSLRNGMNLAVRRQCRDRETATTLILQELLRAGADPDARRTDRSTALHEAARRGPVQAVAALLQFKADHQCVNGVGHHALEIARAAKHEEATRLLGSWPVLRGQFGEAEFFGAWYEFCRDPNSELITGKSAETTLNELLLTQHQESIARMLKDGVEAEDEVLTEWLETTRGVTSTLPTKTKPSDNSTAEIKAAADRKRLIPHGRHDKKLTVSLDKYLTGKADGGFREKHTAGPEGSFAHRKVATIEAANVRYIRPMSSTAGSNDDFYFEHPTARRRVVRAASIVDDGADDGRDEAHVLRNSLQSKLHRTLEQTKPVRDLNRNHHDPKQATVVGKHLTERERNERSNPLMAKLKAMEHTKQDAVQEHAKARTNRRAIFNDRTVLPRKASLLESNQDHWGPQGAPKRRSRPHAGITRRVTADPWKFIDSGFAPHPI